MKKMKIKLVVGLKMKGLYEEFIDDLLFDQFIQEKKKVK